MKQKEMFRENSQNPFILTGEGVLQTPTKEAFTALIGSDRTRHILGF